MGTWNKIVLSGSTDGSIITVATTNTTIHTAVTGAADSIDEIWVYGSRQGSNDGAKLTVSFGTNSFQWGASSGISENGAHLIIPGLVARAALVISASCSTAGDFAVFGFVNRYAT